LEKKPHQRINRNSLLHLKRGSTPSLKHPPTRANQISEPRADYQIIFRGGEAAVVAAGCDEEQRLSVRTQKVVFTSGSPVE